MNMKDMQEQEEDRRGFSDTAVIAMSANQYHLSQNPIQTSHQSLLIKTMSQSL